MTDPAGFTLELDQDKYLRPGKTEVHGVLTVTASGGQPPPAAGTGFAEVILIDCSSSMHWPPTKIAAARTATAAAIDALPDGTAFAVVRGTELAQLVYPRHAELAVAGPVQRAEARAAVERLVAGGGTSIGRWLSLAGDLLRPHPAAVRHVTLLTDGQNNDDPAMFAQVLAECREVFQCDARGIGDDWNSQEVLRIARVLRGRGDAVREEHDLAGDFRAILADALGRRVPDLRIRLSLSEFAEFRYLKQVFPTESDLAEHVRRLDRHTVEIDTGAWGAESRDYQLCIGVGDAGELNDNVRAGRIDLLAGDRTVASPALVLVHRISDPFRSEQLSSRFAHYSEQIELSQAVGDGCDAYQIGNRADALASWERAVALARATGNTEILSRLLQVVEVDEATGRVRLRDHVRRREVLRLDTGSVRLAPPPDGPRPEVTGPDRVCGCGRISPPTANFCTVCRRPLTPARPA